MSRRAHVDKYECQLKLFGFNRRYSGEPIYSVLKVITFYIIYFYTTPISFNALA